MKSPFLLKSSLTAILLALACLPVTAQTLPRTSSAGVQPWQGAVQLKAPIDQSLTSGDSGATLLRPLSAGCPSFTNASTTTAVSVAFMHSGFADSWASASINGALIAYHVGSRNGGAATANVIVPPNYTFTSAYSESAPSCAFTALANNITAQQVGLRWVINTTQTIVSGTTIACSLSGASFTGTGYITSYYNWGAPTIGPVIAIYEDYACVNDTGGGGGGGEGNN
jgi:hypothetical protein